VEILIAQHAMDEESGSLAITLVALVAMLIPWFVLGYISWIFWKAKKRDDGQNDGRDAWRNARSS
jgi:heme/copper-type cytochrome/quinol oxidase subunit 2